MQLLLIRHGESVANRARILQGHFDSPLNAHGLRQAESLADMLADDRIAAIFSSDLMRARQTAQAVADRLSLPLSIDPDLREIHIGIFTGLSWAEIAERYPEHHQRLVESSMDWSVVPEAEGEADSQERLDRFLAKIQARHADERLAIVAHGAILRRLIKRLVGLPPGMRLDFEISNASCTELQLTPRGTRILYMNRLPTSAAPLRGGDSPRPLF